MMLKNYETVFILTPVLSDAQMKDAVSKYKKLLKELGAKIVNEENWGLKKLAYQIQHKSTGFYNLFEFEAPAEAIAKLELELRRDERILRFLTTVLDKHSIAYNAKRKKLKKQPKQEEATA
ncbi:MAG: 30S ribosomal protein S6 [Cyclobacteriaceae bacterium]